MSRCFDNVSYWASRLKKGECSKPIRVVTIRVGDVACRQPPCACTDLMLKDCSWSIWLIRKSTRIAPIYPKQKANKKKIVRIPQLNAHAFKKRYLPTIQAKQAAPHITVLRTLH